MTGQTKAAFRMTTPRMMTPRTWLWETASATHCQSPFRPSRSIWRERLRPRALLISSPSIDISLRIYNRDASSRMRVASFSLWRCWFLLCRPLMVSLVSSNMTGWRFLCGPGSLLSPWSSWWPNWSPPLCRRLASFSSLLFLGFGEFHAVLDVFVLS